MYINNVSILYYVIVGIIGLIVGQLTDWLNIRLPENKKVFSKEERALSANGKTGEFIGYCRNGSIMNEWNIPRSYLEVIGVSGGRSEQDGNWWRI